MRQKIYIVGAGMGAASGLTVRAAEVVKSAPVVLASARIAECLKELRGDILVCTYSDTAQKALSGKDTAILVSGDVGFFSAAAHFMKTLAEHADIELIPCVNSMQYICAKLGVGYENVKIISLHGRTANFLGAVSYNKHTFMLTGGKTKASDICRELAAAGLGNVKAAVGENMSMPNERIITGTAESLASENFDDIAVLFVENTVWKSCHGNLRDDAFVRGEGTPMTKEEVRWVTLAKLNVAPTDIVYDIGAGTGSVSIELARAAYDGIVYAVERDADAFNLLQMNRERLGAYNIVPVFGAAPDALAALPAPDKVFIGGSGGNLESIMKTVYCKNETASVVINAVTLETINEAVAIQRETDIVCVNVSKSRKAGAYTMMTANNPVWVITVK